MWERLTDEVAAFKEMSIDGEARRRYTWPSVEVVCGFGCSLKTWGRSSTRGGFSARTMPWRFPLTSEMPEKGGRLAETGESAKSFVCNTYGHRGGNGAATTDRSGRPFWGG